MSKNVWDDIFANKEWGRYPGEDLVRFIAKNFPTKRGQTAILEVGCGPGCNICYLAKEGFNVYGIDVSMVAIDQARQRLHDSNLRADLRIGDISKISLPSNRFNAVIDIECVYINDIKKSHKILNEIKRVLQPGGLFYSRSFSAGMYVGNTRKNCGHLEYSDISDGPLANCGYVRLMTGKEIVELYGRHFEILSIDKMDYTTENGMNRIIEWVIVSKKE